VAPTAPGVYAFFEAEDSHRFYKAWANRYKLGQISADLELSPKLRLVYDSRDPQRRHAEISAGIA